jgi:ferredoxin-nitrite reductase
MCKSLRCTGKETFSLSITVDGGGEYPLCPSLFSPNVARDGNLVRIRIPGGLLSWQQCHVLAEVSDRLGSSTIDVTNRANIQIRGLRSSVPPEILQQLQDAGLAAKNLELDRFRNIMASPTAGIDLEQAIDSRPLVRELDKYLATNLNLTQLSPKFSIGIDGGEKVSIQEQPNDVFLKAVRKEGDRKDIYFHLYLVGIDARVACLVEDCTAVVGAIARVYLDLVDANASRKPRLKQVLQEIGLDNYLDRINAYFPNLSASKYNKTPATTCDRFGIHAQRQPHLSYIGIALPLGRITTNQLRQISDITQIYGSASLRLTPWRSVLLPDIQDTSSVQKHLENLGLSTAVNNIWEGLIACSGTRGCAAAITDTQGDALALARYIQNRLHLDRAMTIHLTGCPKSCAHHGSSDLTLVGVQIDKGDRQVAGYHLYGGDLEAPFGQKLRTNLLPTELPAKISEIISIYQLRRANPQQSLRDFLNRSDLNQFDTEANSC